MSEKGIPPSSINRSISPTDQSLRHRLRTPRRRAPVRQQRQRTNRGDMNHRGKSDDWKRPARQEYNQTLC